MPRWRPTLATLAPRSHRRPTVRAIVAIEVLYDYLDGLTEQPLADPLADAAADPRTTGEDATRIASMYLYIGVIVTMLDSLIDHERDLLSTGEPGYTRYYESHELLMRGLTDAARHAIARAPRTPHGAHHIMTLVGVVAFYTSAPTANTELARPIADTLQQELRPLITPTLAVLRTWRLAKRIRANRQ